MTHEEAARRYLESSRAASALGGPAYSPAREEHETTMRHLERDHPHVREHALVGTDKDFDQPLGRNEREHQVQLRRDAGLTNTDTAARRKALRAGDYGREPRYKPSEIYNAANPPAPRGAGAGRRAPARRRSGSRRPSLPAPAASAVSDAGSAITEFAVAVVALALLYLFLRSEEKGGKKVVSTTLTGVSGLFRRLVESGNDLFSASQKPAGKQAPQVGPSSAKALAAANPGNTPSIFGLTLPNYSAVTPTIP